MEKETKVIVLYESVADSIASDVMTFATVIAMIGVGVFVGSSAMQWVGAILFLLSLFGRSMGRKETHVYSFDAARKRIDELEAKAKGKRR